MTYIKAKYSKNDIPAGRAYTYRSEENLSVGDKVETADGKHLIVVDEPVDMEWAETYGSDKVAVVKKVERWYFTFGSDHAHPGHYVVFEGNFSETREKMCEKYLGRWAFQYSEDEWNKNVVNSAMLGY